MEKDRWDQVTGKLDRYGAHSSQSQFQNIHTKTDTTMALPYIVEEGVVILTVFPICSIM